MTFDYVAQPQEAVTNCDLCGGRSFSPYAFNDRYLLPVASVMCQGCGLLFLNPRMTAEAYAKFYGNGVYRKLLDDYYKSDITNTVGQTQEAYGNWLAWFLRPYLLNRAGTLLDVGGSEGRVADILYRKYRFEPTILEPAGAEADKARTIGFEVIDGSLETWDPAGRKFDVIMLCQTIDHLLSISKSLETIKRAMSPGALFFVDISDFRSVLRQHKEQYGIIKVDHPFYLTPITLERYLTKAGLRVVDRIGGWKSYQHAVLCEAA